MTYFAGPAFWDFWLEVISNLILHIYGPLNHAQELIDNFTVFKYCSFNHNLGGVSRGYFIAHSLIASGHGASI